MNTIRNLATRLLPSRLARRLTRRRRWVRSADREAAWQNKREFFWQAFKALDYNGIKGDYVEFGSHGGMTFRLAFDQISARKIKRHLWSFDSFQGLPAADLSADDHPHWKKGAMATGLAAFHAICRRYGMARNAYTLVPGFYEETLPPLALDAPPADIALVYVDCDLYASTRAVLEFLRPRLKHGMILAFDDYFCWSADQVAGERKALWEAFPDDGSWRLLRYRDIGWAGTSFLVERADLLGPPARRMPVTT